MYTYTHTHTSVCLYVFMYTSICIMRVCTAYKIISYLKVSFPIFHPAYDDV